MTMNRLLLTGAAGGLGKILRDSLKPYARVMRLSDVAAMEPAGEGEEVVPCDLGDKKAVDELVRGCDAIVHLGGVSIERPFEEILDANHRGVFAQNLGHTIVYGMSANRDKWWDNRKAAHLEYHPRDSSEPFRAKVESQPLLAPSDPAATHQGGAFVRLGPFED